MIQVTCNTWHALSSVIAHLLDSGEKFSVELSSRGMGDAIFCNAHAAEVDDVNELWHLWDTDFAIITLDITEDIECDECDRETPGADALDPRVAYLSTTDRRYGE